ncbi:MAG: hypothetical protein ACLR6B_16125 [Blautia sp.]
MKKKIDFQTSKIPCKKVQAAILLVLVLFVNISALKSQMNENYIFRQECFIKIIQTVNLQKDSQNVQMKWFSFCSAEREARRNSNAFCNK